MNNGFQGFGGSGGLGSGIGSGAAFGFPNNILLCDPALSFGTAAGVFAQAAVAAINTAYYVPFTSPVDFKITKLWTVLAGGAPAGNFDMGLYKGNSLVFSQGTVAVGAAGAKSVACNIQIAKNVRYYTAFASTSTSNAWAGFGLGASYSDAFGIAKETAYPLPAASTKVAIGAVGLATPVLIAEIAAP